MYVMMAVIFGSLVVGCTGKLSLRRQTMVALTVAVAATAVYYFAQGAM